MFRPDHPALAELSTPCLVVDGAALQRNIDKMAALARSAGVKLRPHAKTHKSPDIARRQVAAGATGIACATIAEAEMLATARIRGLMLTAPVMSTSSFTRLAKLNREHGMLAVIDHPQQVEWLTAAVQPGDPRFGVLVDVDVGQARTGTVEIADGVQLARVIAEQPKLKFEGIQGFAGNAQHIPEPAERTAAAQRAANKLIELREALSLGGLKPDIITGSGTGTQNLDARGPYTELQVGSYVFMDADYDRIRDERNAPPPFEPSLFVLGTVVLVNRPSEITVDAGTKALATNGPAPVALLGAPPGSKYRFAGDEHGIVSIPEGQPSPPLGARILIGVTHCDPTVNLHGCYYEVTDDTLTRWPVLARHGDASAPEPVR
jgi:D-serine deaminase-like pyridoxal phosphate-dependent protein